MFSRGNCIDKMPVGEVKIAEDTDYAYFKAMCKVHEDWTNVYQKNSTCVWTKQNDVSDFKMIKVKILFTSTGVYYFHIRAKDQHWDFGCSF